MEEDLGQTNTIKLLLLPGHWKQNPRHLCEPAPWPAGYPADKNRVPTMETNESVSCHEREVVGNVVEDSGNGVSRFALLL